MMRLSHPAPAELNGSRLRAELAAEGIAVEPFGIEMVPGEGDEMLVQFEVADEAAAATARGIIDAHGGEPTDEGLARAAAAARLEGLWPDAAAAARGGPPMSAEQLAEAVAALVVLLIPPPEGEL